MLGSWQAHDRTGYQSSYYFLHLIILKHQQIYNTECVDETYYGTPF